MFKHLIPHENIIETFYEYIMQNILTICIKISSRDYIEINFEITK